MSGLLLASLAMLASGPLLARFARTRPQLLAFIDGFVLLSIGGLVLLDVLPPAITRRDLTAGLCMLAGFILPTIAERMLHYGVRQTHTTVLVLAFAGIIGPSDRPLTA